MTILKDFTSQKVFEYFEEICAIPHGSRDTKKISDYCVDFAKNHNLRYIQDEFNNIVIFKSGTKGYEDSKPVIIQGHLDMVCEKENDCNIDFANDALDIFVEGDFIKAKGTTLGGDDGIAVAMALAILDSDDIAHPPIEAVFTVDEEIGMLGAAAFDYSVLDGRIMLNIDSEEEGHLLVSCAGGVTATCHLPVEYEDAEGMKVLIKVTGLTGGHSGVEIDKGRGNANRILGRVLYDLKEEFDFNIISVNGGLKDNAIPREAVAEIIVKNAGENLSGIKTDLLFAKLEKYISNYSKILENEYRLTDSDVKVVVEKYDGNLDENTNVDFKINISKEKVFTDDSTKKVITALVNLPGGIEKMSRDFEGLVQTSLNMGILKSMKDKVVFSFCVRSSVESEKIELVQRLKCLMEILGGNVECKGDYPAWEYKEDSMLREIMIEIYKELYGNQPMVDAMHAGVECGLFAGNLPGLDCISFGPDIFDIHTPKERLSISSVERTWKFLLAVLKRLQ
ncbi:MAG: aminoacyl-histidine dipeptidase [Lachnospiraceae bacterium]|nr:aminoacyl-histidine dipeptidase [Lachnospiraceae bacterium]